MSLAAKVERTIAASKLLIEGDSVIVAVSGGPDSVALLHVLVTLSSRYGWRLTAAHVNHGFRGEESDREAEYVRQLSLRLNVPCEIASIDVPGFIRETGLNPQAAAREKRYAFLLELAEKLNASRIALAHHADDQAETMLFRLLRGTGPSGLSGMPERRTEKNVELVRPLLRIYKSELLEYCDEHGLAFCTDSSNLERKYMRNKIRLDVLPYLSRYNEKLPESLNRLSVIMSEEEHYMEQQTLLLFEGNVARKEGVCSFSASWFSGIHIALQRRMIKLILNCLATGRDVADFDKVERICTSIMRTDRSNVTFDVAGSILFTREYDTIILHTMVLPEEAFSFQLLYGDAQVALDGWRIACEWLVEGNLSAHVPRGRLEIALDCDRIAFPLTVRSRLPGDRICIAGLNGSKKVKDIFIDEKVPPAERERVPIVADSEGRLLWVAGYRRSGLAPVTGETKRILYMKLNSNTSHM